VGCDYTGVLVHFAPVAAVTMDVKACQADGSACTAAEPALQAISAARRDFLIYVTDASIHKLGVEFQATGGTAYCTLVGVALVAGSTVEMTVATDTTGLTVSNCSRCDPAVSCAP
jgi:hypothetical protein